MFFNPNSYSVNLLVTILMAVMVFVLPWLDRRICNARGVSINDGVSENPDADRILKHRKVFLIFMFCVYLAMIAYVAFFSRSAAEDYRVHVALFEDLASSIHIDLGILGFFKTIFTDGFAAAMNHVRIDKTYNITQVYMNIAMFVPLGYLLPYVFDWFRRDIRHRTIPACFIVSLLIENIQLMTKLGFYDVDDIFSNTIGGWIGAWLFVTVAYVNTHPDWRKRLRKYRKWKFRSRHRALSPFFRKMHVARTTVYCNQDSPVPDFLMTALGFQEIERYTDAETGNEKILLECNKTGIELIVLKNAMELPEQKITIAANNSERIRWRLEEQRFELTDYEADPYTGLRTFSLTCPGNLTIMYIEE